MSTLNTWTFAASGNGASYVLDHKRAFQVDAFGTFGGGSLTLQYSPDGGTTWNTVGGVSLTANGNSGALGGVQGDLFRPVLTGATSPSLTVIARETVK